MGAHGCGQLKSIKIAQINKNERNQQFWCDQMKRPQKLKFWHLNSIIEFIERQNFAHFTEYLQLKPAEINSLPR